MSTYAVIVHALDQRDAIDIARRMAERDGFRSKGATRPPHRVGPPMSGRWAVELEVTRDAPTWEGIR